MKNPYRRWSLRPLVLVVLSVLLLLKSVAVLLMMGYLAVLSGAIVCSIILDVWTIYHMTTGWHRLRHAWIILLSPTVNLIAALFGLNLLIPGFLFMYGETSGRILLDTWLMVLILAAPIFVVGSAITHLVSALILHSRLRKDGPTHAFPIS